MHYSGHSATVTVYSAGKIHTVKVRVGTKGLVMTRITAGLKAGQHVVLADLRKPLPSNNLPGGAARVLVSTSLSRPESPERWAAAGSHGPDPPTCGGLRRGSLPARRRLS